MPRRIQRKRVKDWRKPEGAVIVDRTSIWENPWPVSVYGAETARRNFILWLDGKLEGYAGLEAHRQRILKRMPELRDKDLVCFCPEDAEWCHADEYLVRANQE